MALAAVLACIPDMLALEQTEQERACLSGGRCQWFHAQ